MKFGKINLNLTKSIMVILALVLLSGCFGVNQSFRQIRRQIMSDVDGDFSRIVEISVGPAGLYLTGLAASLADAEIDVAAMIRKISRVQVSVYENEDWGDVTMNNSLTRKLSDKMSREGWTCLVKTRDHEEMSLVFAREDGEKINQMFVIALSEENFVMTEISGDLSGLVELALKDKGLNLQIAKR